jgi:hypothetical protein
MYHRLSYVFEGALLLKTFVLYIYWLRSTMNNKREGIFIVKSAYNLVVQTGGGNTNREQLNSARWETTL